MACLQREASSSRARTRRKSVCPQLQLWGAANMAGPRGEIVRIQDLWKGLLLGCPDFSFHLNTLF
eukprot:14775970-Alexandrium_andersonii.AAC.1